MSSEAIQVPAGLTTEGLLGKRYMARFIDSVILSILLVLSVAVVGTGRAERPSILLLGILLVLWVTYGTLLESSARQATLGKMAMGLRVYDARGARLTAGQAALRNLVKDGPFLLLGAVPGGNLLAFALLIAHIVVIQRSDVNQAIHDRLAHTWVSAPEGTTQLHIA